MCFRSVLQDRTQPLEIVKRLAARSSWEVLNRLERVDAPRLVACSLVARPRWDRWTSSTTAQLKSATARFGAVRRLSGRELNPSGREPKGKPGLNPNSKATADVCIDIPDIRLYRIASKIPSLFLTFFKKLELFYGSPGRGPRVAPQPKRKMKSGLRQTDGALIWHSRRKETFPLTVLAVALRERNRYQDCS
jgi:hypothetical protein